MNGTIEKEKGMARVTRSPWQQEAHEAMSGLPPGWEGTGQDVRHFLMTDCEMDPPHHPNAWGAMISGAVRNKMLRPTGRYVKAKYVQSHARKLEVYIRN